MKYILRSEEAGKFNFRYWTGFGGGFSCNPANARIFNTMKHAEIESDMILNSQRIGTQVRPVDRIIRRDYGRRSLW